MSCNTTFGVDIFIQKCQMLVILCCPAFCFVLFGLDFPLLLFLLVWWLLLLSFSLILFLLLLLICCCYCCCCRCCCFCFVVIVLDLLLLLISCYYYVIEIRAKRRNWRENEEHRRDSTNNSQIFQVMVENNRTTFERVSSRTTRCARMGFQLFCWQERHNESHIWET